MRKQELFSPYLDEESEIKKRKKLIFDPTINLNHIISLIGIFTFGIGIYASLDKRVLVLETNNSRQDLRDLTQDTDRARISNEMKDATVDIKHSIDRINEKLDRINDVRK